jgi:hypothetical protein
MTESPAFIPRPPRHWELLTVALIVAVAAVTVFGMILLATDLGVRHYLATDGASGMSPLVRMVAEHGSDADTVYLLLVFAYIGGFLLWRHRTREVLRGFGDSTGAAVQHWAVLAWNLAIGVAFVLRLSGPSAGADPSRDEIASALGLQAFQMAVRIVGLGLLLIGVWQIREQVRRTVAASGVAPRPADLGLRPSAVPGRPLAPIRRAAVPDADARPAADDEFWERVRRTAAGVGTGLALLETTGALVHRWALVPESGDVDAVRAGLAPGAVVTVFPEPPADTETAGFTPAPAQEYYGFLEDADGGALWFQLVTPKRVPAFLARARSARRWGLYHSGDPAALTAVVPGPAQDATPA